MYASSAHFAHKIDQSLQTNDDSRGEKTGKLRSHLNFGGLMLFRGIAETSRSEI